MSELEAEVAMQASNAARVAEEAEERVREVRRAGRCRAAGLGGGTRCVLPGGAVGACTRVRRAEARQHGRLCRGAVCPSNGALALAVRRGRGAACFCQLWCGGVCPGMGDLLRDVRQGRVRQGAVLAVGCSVAYAGEECHGTRRLDGSVGRAGTRLLLAYALRPPGEHGTGLPCFSTVCPGLRASLEETSRG